MPASTSKFCTSRAQDQVTFIKPLGQVGDRRWTWGNTNQFGPLRFGDAYTWDFELIKTFGDLLTGHLGTYKANLFGVPLETIPF